MVQMPKFNLKFNPTPTPIKLHFFLFPPLTLKSQYNPELFGVLTAVPKALAKPFVDNFSLC